MKIYLGSDHAGFELKERIKKYLDRSGISYEDVGNDVLESRDDYPDYAMQVAQKVSSENNAHGVLFCGNGVGVCITANKFPNVRAVNTQSRTVAVESREEDDTNILCLAGRHVSYERARKILKAWLGASFKKKARYSRRLEKIKQIENTICKK